MLAYCVRSNIMILRSDIVWSWRSDILWSWSCCSNRDHRILFCHAVKLPILKTRLVALWNVMHPGHFLIILLLMFLGALCSSCLTEFFGYTSGLWYMCEVNGLVLFWHRTAKTQCWDCCPHEIQCRDCGMYFDMVGLVTWFLGATCRPWGYIWLANRYHSARYTSFSSVYCRQFCNYNELA